MELSEVVNPHYAFPVGFVLICAVLVFAFGFKSAEQPAFAQLSYTSDDRKPAGKKRKIKDKQKSQHVGQGNTSSDEQPGVKGTTKNDAEKELSSKAVSKQDKQKKQEASPVKEQKNINKDVTKVTTGKPQKENRESIAKPLKEKKQESSEKSPAKDSNKLVAKQAKGKSNESKGEEIKNRKNERNLAKLKAEEKPSDFDDGEWEQALSRKDKKSRKKDDPLLIDDAVESAGKENKSPLKKKSNAKIDKDSVKMEITVDEIKIVEDAVEKTLSEKQPQKDTEEEKRKSKKPVKDVIEEEKILEEVGNAIDGGNKLKKKLKKKAANKSADPEVSEAVEIQVQEVVVKEKKPVQEAVVKEKKPVQEVVVKEKKPVQEVVVKEKKPVQEVVVKEKKPVQEVVVKEKKPVQEVVVKEKKPMQEVVAKEKKQVQEVVLKEKKQVELKEKENPPAAVTESKSESKVEPESGVVFDELGDVWKEAKAQKKSKKKVRKDQ